MIYERTIELIDTYHPDEMALEAPFFGKNVQSMLKLGRAQGVAMAAGLSRQIPVTEYLPKKIKMAITGNGNAFEGTSGEDASGDVCFKRTSEKFRCHRWFSSCGLSFL
jgi:crossover junction endodeoxyribonuclease RuvC